MTECEHGEARGIRYCALCRAAGIRGEAETSSPTPHLSHDLDWESRAKHAIWELATSGQPFTSEDITDLVGFPDPLGHRANGPNNRIGLLLNRVAKSYGLRRVDMKPAKNQRANGRLLTVWTGRRR